ncbi:MAG: hypothetical protein WC742_11510 [Gallionellaceae bacterium]|jgi:hypothetical protein
MKLNEFASEDFAAKLIESLDSAFIKNLGGEIMLPAVMRNEVRVEV